MEDQNTHQEPLIQQPPQTVTNQSHRLNPILMGIGAVLLLGLGLLGGYFIFSPKTPLQPNSNQKVQTSPVITIELSPTNIISPTSSISNWKSHTTTQLEENGFKPYTISFPESWIKEINRTNDSDTLKLTKENHIITIYQAAFGGGGCIFEGEIPEGPYGDLRNKKYVEIQSDIGILRRFDRDYAESDPAVITFDFCVNTSGTYHSPTKIGSITYIVPKNYNEALIKEMDSIIKTLSEIN